MRKKDFLSVLILLFFDLLSFYLSLSLSYFLRKTIVTKISGIPPIEYKTLVSHFWMPLVFLIFMFFEELYTKRRPFFSELSSILKAVFFSTITIFAIVALTKVYIRVSRATIIISGFFLLLFTPVLRRLVKYLLFKAGIWQISSILVLKQSEDFEKEKFSSDFYSGYRVVKKVSYEELKKAEINDMVLIFSGLSDRELSIDDLSFFISKKVKEIIFLSSISALGFTNYEIMFPVMKDKLFFRVSNKLLSPLNRFLKTFLDYTLFFLFLPFSLFAFFFIALLIKIDSKGRVIFSQERIGKNGKLFKYYKFRTMYENSDELLKDYLKKNPEKRIEWEKYKKLKDYDPRITRVGKILRKTSLDELPQIINVFLGDMSFVGPRPYLEREKKDMGEFYDLITKVKPGLTGLWQVSGRNELEFKDRLRMDVFYIKNWSLWLDIVILIKTIKTVLKGEGAY